MGIMQPNDEFYPLDIEAALAGAGSTELRRQESEIAAMAFFSAVNEQAIDHPGLSLRGSNLYNRLSLGEDNESVLILKDIVGRMIVNTGYRQQKLAVTVPYDAFESHGLQMATSILRLTDAENPMRQQVSYVGIITARPAERQLGTPLSDEEIRASVSAFIIPGTTDGSVVSYVATGQKGVFELLSPESTENFLYQELMGRFVQGGGNIAPTSD